MQNFWIGFEDVSDLIDQCTISQSRLHYKPWKKSPLYLMLDAKRFIFKNKSDLFKHENQTETHLGMRGGSGVIYTSHDFESDQFPKYFRTSLEKGHILTLVEKRTPIFRLFFDLDLKLTYHTFAPPFTNQRMHMYIQFITHQITNCFGSSTKVIVSSRQPRLIYKNVNGENVIDKISYGYHLNCPTLFVSVEDALMFRWYLCHLMEKKFSYYVDHFDWLEESIPDIINLVDEMNVKDQYDDLMKQMTNGDIQPFVKFVDRIKDQWKSNMKSCYRIDWKTVIDGAVYTGDRGLRMPYTCKYDAGYRKNVEGNPVWVDHGPIPCSIYYPTHVYMTMGSTPDHCELCTDGTLERLQTDVEYTLRMLSIRALYIDYISNIFEIFDTNLEIEYPPMEEMMREAGKTNRKTNNRCGKRPSLGTNSIPLSNSTAYKKIMRNQPIWNIVTSVCLVNFKKEFGDFLVVAILWYPSTGTIIANTNSRRCLNKPPQLDGTLGEHSSNTINFKLTKRGISQICFSTKPCTKVNPRVHNVACSEFCSESKKGYYRKYGKELNMYFNPIKQKQIDLDEDLIKHVEKDLVLLNTRSKVINIKRRIRDNPIMSTLNYMKAFRKGTIDRSYLSSKKKNSNRKRKRGCSTNQSTSLKKRKINK
jgi:hypothetical protein